MSRPETTAANAANLQLLLRLLEGFAPEQKEWTPLHTASVLGDVDAARVILRRNPEFLKLLNPNGCNALHLASSCAHSRMVEFLLEFGRNPSIVRDDSSAEIVPDNSVVVRDDSSAEIVPHPSPIIHQGTDNDSVIIRDMCMKKDEEGMTPLHHAVLKGDHAIVHKLLAVCPDSALEVTQRKETVFHLALKNKLQVSEELFLDLLLGPYSQFTLNLGDKEGNTVLHLAAVRKQIEIIKLLAYKSDKSDVNALALPPWEVNAVNSSGLTPLDLLVVDPTSVIDMTIETLMLKAGGIRLNDSKEQREDLKSITSGLFTMASLTATTSCQIGLYLRGNFQQKLAMASSGNSTASIVSNTTTAAIQKHLKVDYMSFMFWDTAAFLISFSIIATLLFPAGNELNRLKWHILRFLSYLNVAVFFTLLASLMPYGMEWKTGDYFTAYLPFQPLVLLIAVLILIPLFKVFRTVSTWIRFRTKINPIFFFSPVFLLLFYPIWYGKMFKKGI